VTAVGARQNLAPQVAGHRDRADDALPLAPQGRGEPSNIRAIA